MTQVVKCLVDLAVDSIFQDIVAKLSNLPSNKAESSSPPPAKKRKVVSSTSAIVASIRAQLHEYLVSSYSQVRHDLIKKLMQTHFCSSSQFNCQDKQKLVLSFLDSVLDNSFNSLNLSGSDMTVNKGLASIGFATKKIPLPLTEPALLLEIVAHRSPLLKKLKFAFTLPSQTAPPGPSFSLQLGQLVNLTSLSLSLKTTDSCIDLFISLGQSLSQLASLHLAQLPFDTDQLLALILGSKHALLPPNFSTQAAKLLDLQFTPESTSPICSSLKQLILECDKSVYFCQYKLPQIALVYRHFSQMENYGRSNCKHPILFANPLLPVFQQLHKKKKINIGNRKSPRLLEKNITTKSCKELGLLQWIVDAPFNGHLKLVELPLVNIRSRKMMQAVTSLCLNLRTVHFYSPAMTASDLMSVQELQSMFTREQSNTNSCWSKITEVEFIGVPPSYRQVFLSLFGHQLNMLNFSFSNSNIDPVKELLPCTQLEALSISPECTIVPLPTGAEMPLADTFLPQLKTLKICICLREWSPLFECHRPSLVSLLLACPHFAIASRGEFGWTDLPLLWPNMRQVCFSRSDEFTVDLLCQIAPQLKSLQYLVLPKNFCQSDEECQRLNKFCLQLRKQVPAGLRIFRHPSQMNISHN